MYTEYLRTISTIFLALFIIDITGLFSFENKILMIIGNMSFEIYLVHSLFIRIADTKGYDSNFAIISIVIVSLIIAYPINKFVVYVNKKLSSLMNSKTEKRV